MTLKDIAIGQSAVIVKVGGEDHCASIFWTWV